MHGRSRLAGLLRWKFAPLPMLLLHQCYLVTSFMLPSCVPSAHKMLPKTSPYKFTTSKTVCEAFRNNMVETSKSTTGKSNQEEDVLDGAVTSAASLQQQRVQVPPILNVPQVRQFLMESGFGRTLMDASIVFHLQSILEKYPNALIDYLHTSGVPASLLKTIFKDQRPTLDFDVKFDRYQYGSHESQVIHVYNRANSNNENNGIATSSTSTPTKSIMFVHGGAWGSGFPALYRVLAQPFLQKGYQVAIVGYRTYPTGIIQDQIDDVVSAVKYFRSINDNHDITLMGHSSGAHISMMALLNMQKEKLEQSSCQKQRKRPIIDRFIGLSGVYCIPSHYMYEKVRGVDGVSPTSSASGGVGDEDAWNRISPIYLIQQQEKELLSKKQKEQLREQEQELDSKGKSITAEKVLTVLENLPPMLIAHGAADTVVPRSASENLYKSLKQLNKAKGVDIDMDDFDLQIWDGIEHSEIVYHLMFGGPAREKILNWLEKNTNKQRQ